MASLTPTLQGALADIDHYLAQASNVKQGPAGSYLLLPLPAGWHFGHDFPNLPAYLDNSPGHIGESHPSFLLDLPFQEGYFILSAADQQLTDPLLQKPANALQQHYRSTTPGLGVTRGVNFVALLDPQTSGGAMGGLWGALNLLTGRNPAAPLPFVGYLDSDQLLWLTTRPAAGQTKLGPLSMADLDLTLFSDLTTADGPAGLTLTADFTLGKDQPITLTITADLPIGNWDTLHFTGQFEGLTLANLAQLADLAGHDIDGSLPADLKGLANYGIQAFALGLAPAGTNKIASFSLLLGADSAAKWNLIDGVLAIAAPSLRLLAYDPLSSGRELILTIEDQLQLWGGTLQLAAQVPLVAPAGTQLPTVTASLVAGPTIALNPFLAAVLPFQLSSDSSLTISSLSFSGDFAAQQYSFDLTVDGHWPLLGNNLVLEELQLSLSYSSGQRGSAVGMITATLNLADDLSLTLLAELPQTNGGWKFSGRTAPLTLSSQSLQQKMATLFGLPWPAVLGDLTIETLYLVLDTAAKDFYFVCKGQLPIESVNLAARITVDLRHQAAGGYETDVAGFLTLTLPDGDALDFDLIIEAGSQATTFVAAYVDPAGKSRPVHDLVALLSNDWAKTIPQSLAFGLKDALLVRRAAPAARWLFTLDIDGNLNLSDIHLPDLPLLGSGYSPTENLALSLSLRLPSQPFQLDDVKALNQLLPEPGLHLPEQAIPALALATLLQIGDTHLPLTLPIGANQTNSGPPLLSPPTAQTTPAPTDNPAADAIQPSDGTQWVKVQKSFGPVHIERVGLAYHKGQISGLLDAALTVGGLTISLQGLTVSSPLSPISPTFDLHGLGIDYRNGPLELAGSFLRQATNNGTEYDGLALLRSEALTLGAIGSYAALKDGSTSLFIYAVLDYPLGGPSFFFVTGLAAGFGYNRALLMPPVDQVANFPLVVEAVNGPPSLPAGADNQRQTITNQLTSLAQYVPVAIGQNFLAVGLKFTSFKLIDSFALLAVQFGQRFEIDLLGLSTLLVPAAEAGNSATPLAEAQLALRARFVPDEGILQVQAQLTAASYVLSHDCHLTGGFAFYSWFKGDHAGDFVLSLGGYHPRFNPPDYYPQVPRLGINWRLNDNFSIKGQAYFALTGHALMAGGSLEATWQSGSVYAHFIAGADFLITWQPYHYDIEVYISISAGVTVHVFGTHHLSFDAGADLHLWGPEFAGHAHVHLKVWIVKVSFDVSFGGGASRIRPIDWATFTNAFLPKNSESGALSICSLAAQTGLIRQVEDEDKSQRWIVNPKDFVLATDSLIPANKAVIGGQAVMVADIAPVGVQPMGIPAGQLTTTHIIKIIYDDDQRSVTDHFIFDPILKSVPAGMWAEPVLDGDFLQSPGVNEPRLVNNALSGFEMRLRPPARPEHSQTVDRRELQYDTEPVNNGFNWESLTPFDPDPTLTMVGLSRPDEIAAREQQIWQRVQQTIVHNPQRDKLLQELGLADLLIDFGQPLDQDLLAVPQMGR